MLAMRQMGVNASILSELEEALSSWLAYLLERGVCNNR